MNSLRAFLYALALASLACATVSEAQPSGQVRELERATFGDWEAALLRNDQGRLTCVASRFATSDGLAFSVWFRDSGHVALALMGGTPSRPYVAERIQIQIDGQFFDADAAVTNSGRSLFMQPAIGQVLFNLLFALQRGRVLSIHTTGGTYRFSLSGSSAALDAAANCATRIRIR